MPSLVYTEATKLIGTGALDWESADIRAILVDSSTTADTDEDANVIDDITTLGELSGAGYSRKVLGSKSVVEDNANDRQLLDAADVSYTGINAGTAVGMLIYLHVTNDTDSIPLFYIEFTSAIVTNGGDLTLQLPVTGACVYNTGGGSNVWMTEGLGELARGDIDWEADDLRVILVGNTNTVIASRDANTISGITTLGELSGTGYSRKTLANAAANENVGSDRTEYDADDVTYSGINAGTATGILIYKHVTDDADSIPLLFIDRSASPIVTNGGNMTIQWSAQGLFTLSQGSV